MKLKNIKEDKHNYNEGFWTGFVAGVASGGVLVLIILIFALSSCTPHSAPVKGTSRLQTLPTDKQ